MRSLVRPMLANTGPSLSQHTIAGFFACIRNFCWSSPDLNHSVFHETKAHSPLTSNGERAFILRILLLYSQVKFTVDGVSSGMKTNMAPSSKGVWNMSIISGEHGWRWQQQQRCHLLIVVLRRADRQSRCLYPIPLSSSSSSSLVPITDIASQMLWLALLHIDLPVIYPYTWESHPLFFQMPRILIWKYTA